MTKYLARRLIESIPVIIGVSVLVFMLLHLIPGDPATTILGERATPENVEALRERLGLNKPLYEQYFIWVGRMLRGDLGNTVRGNIPVADEISSRFPATIELALAALIIAVIAGVPIGILSAIKRNSILDTASMFGALFGVSIPIFVLGLLLIFLIGVELEWLPFVGRLDSSVRFERVTGLHLVDSLIAGNLSGFKNALEHLILPAITLATIPLAIIARITRSAMLEVLNQDYIRTARAKGLRGRSVVMNHAFRNAMLPVVTIIGLQLGRLLSGAVLTETIYSWPGVGKWLFDSIIARDYPIVQSMTLVIALIFIAVNLFVDLLYALIDPRIRY
ncbi:MAG: ABC transporter permease [Anaerolineae bacterium]|nr:ABC transporter permease [Anaerolineae bacterium]